MKIVIPDTVSSTAKKIFEDNNFKVKHEPGIDIQALYKLSKDADALVVRSYNLHDLFFSDSLRAIGRAGAGVNNIPVEKCSENGVVVFNTPGANANAVKELVLCGLFLSSRKIIEGINWTHNQKQNAEKVPKLVEDNKKQFKGTEIKGKTLGVIGLGAVGILVANDADSLGMNVIGFDPYITVEHAWMLSRTVKNAKEMDSLIKEADYLTVHVPLNDKTKGLINKRLFKKMKKGIKIMNFSRYEIIDTNDLVKALKDGTVEKYITDFPSHELIGYDNVILIPHLGASTEEAEENSALIISNQIIDFLKEGNIKNSVNFPDCKLDRHGETRITIINKNVPGMIEKITKIFAQTNVNIEAMINRSKGDYAYNIFNVSGNIEDDMIEKLNKIEGAIKIRKL